MQNTTWHDLESIYPTALIRGVRIVRLGEKHLGPASTDVATCRVLGEEQIGWFVGGVPTYDRMIENVRRINDARTGGRWIVVPATRFLAEIAHQQWFGEEGVGKDSEESTIWHDELITFCVPEKLHELQDSIIRRDESVAGIILLDPDCIVHRGRGFEKGRFRIANDRPQMIVDYRSKLAVGNWCPPLIVLSLHKAAAVPTDSVARIYGLEAMHFVEGVSLRCGAIRSIQTNCLEKKYSCAMPSDSRRN